MGRCGRITDKGCHGWDVIGTRLGTMTLSHGFNPLPMPAIFEPRIAKEINKPPLIRVTVICSEHSLLLQDSYKGVGSTSTSPESILHKMIIFLLFLSNGVLLNNKPIIYGPEKRVFLYLKYWQKTEPYKIIVTIISVSNY